MSFTTAELAARFGGFETATVDGKNPKLNPDFLNVLTCEETYIDKTQQGESYFIEAKIAQSNDPSRPAGTLVTIPIHYIFNPTDYKKATAWGQLKAFVSAILSQHSTLNPGLGWVHPETPSIPWVDIVSKSGSKEAVGPFPPGGLFKGVPFVCQQYQEVRKSVNPQTGQPNKQTLYRFWAINDPSCPVK